MRILFLCSLLFSNWSYAKNTYLDLDITEPGDIIEFTQDTYVAAFNSSTVLKAEQSCPEGSKVPQPNETLGLAYCIPWFQVKKGQKYKVVQSRVTGCYTSRLQPFDEVCENSIEFEAIGKNNKKTKYFFFQEADYGSSATTNALVMREAAPRSPLEQCQLLAHDTLALYLATRFKEPKLSDKMLALLRVDKSPTKPTLTLPQCHDKLTRARTFISSLNPMPPHWKTIMNRIDAQVLRKNSGDSSQTTYSAD